MKETPNKKHKKTRKAKKKMVDSNKLEPKKLKLNNIKSNNAELNKESLCNGEHCLCMVGISPYMPLPAEITNIKKGSDDIRIYRVKCHANPMPGQFIQVSLPGYGEAPISVASYSRDYIDLLVRSVGELTNEMAKLKKGDILGVRGPYGKGFPMHYFKGNNVILIGGGTGVAPLKSIIEYIETHRDYFKDVYIFFGFRTPKDILFKEDIKRWKQKFNVIVTVDKEAINANNNKTGKDSFKKEYNKNDRLHDKVGLVTSALAESRLDNYNKIVATCGPPVMIKFAIKTLKEMGFNDDQIYVSLERMMKCGIRKCGRCMIGGKYVCEDGPVFNYETAKWLED